MDLRTLSVVSQRLMEVRNEAFAQLLSVLASAQDGKACKKLHKELTAHLRQEKEADGSDWERAMKILGGSF